MNHDSLFLSKRAARRCRRDYEDDAPHYLLARGLEAEHPFLDV
jgi:hypothetical protein